MAITDSDLMSNKANSIEVAPRSARLARGAWLLRFWLGSHRMYQMRRLLSKAGVWRLCFEGGEEFPPLDPRTESRLRNLLRPEIEALELLLERDLSNWKSGRADLKPANHCTPHSPKRLLATAAKPSTTEG